MKKIVKHVFVFLSIVGILISSMRSRETDAMQAEKDPETGIEDSLEQSTTDFVIKDNILIEYRGHDAKVLIPEGVTSIGQDAFIYNQDIVNVIIPDGVTFIDDMAFFQCTSLETVQFPETLRYIGSLAFSENPGLVHLVLPEGLEGLGMDAFAGCTSLEDVQMPKSLSDIEEYAFSRCPKLKSIDLSAVKKMGRGAFWGDTGLMQVDISSLEWAGDRVFENTNIDFGNMEHLPEMNIMEENPFRNSNYWRECGNGETKNEFWIVDGVLLSGQGCSGKVEIPETVTKIAAYAFANNDKITSVTMPDTVVALGDKAFYRCKKLKTVSMKDSVTELGKETFCFCPKLSQVRLSNQIEVFPWQVFYDCQKLTELTLPEKIAKLEELSLPGAMPKKVTVPLGNWEAHEYPGLRWKDILYVTDISKISQFPVLKELAQSCEVRELALTDTKLTLRVGEKYPLRFNSGAKATWKSSKKSVATVGQTGNIYAKKPGTTTITATIYGKKYTCTVKVIKK